MSAGKSVKWCLCLCVYKTNTELLFFLWDLNDDIMEVQLSIKHYASLIVQLSLKKRKIFLLSFRCFVVSGK